MQRAILFFALSMGFGYAWDWIFRRGTHHGENVTIATITAAITYWGSLWN